MQKTSSTYNDVHGGKWHFRNMVAHIEATHGRDAAMQLTDDIHWIFIQSLKAVQVWRACPRLRRCPARLIRAFLERHAERQALL